MIDEFDEIIFASLARSLLITILFSLARSPNSAPPDGWIHIAATEVRPRPRRSRGHASEAASEVSHRRPHDINALAADDPTIIISVL